MTHHDHMSDEMSSAREAFGQGRARWPGVGLREEDFIRRMREADVPAASLDDHGADLYLASACLAGDRSALRFFDREYLSKTGMFVGRLGGFSDFHEEVAQKLREKLLLGSPPKLAAYVGAGPLVDWLRVAAVRTGINLARPERRRVSIVDEIERIIAPSETPELQALVSHHRKQLKRAIDAAFQRLDAAERTLLKMQYIDRLGIDQLATIHGTHRATIARRLVRLRERMMAEVTADLGTNQGWSPTTLHSLWRVCRSGLEVSVSRLLGGTGPSHLVAANNSSLQERKSDR
jgi:RNA polymerase sigma-70 factor (ECF subfamily)